jgi:hypothetical protein
MIKVNVASARGHDVAEFETGTLALDFVQQTAKSEKKWVFVDGEIISDLAGLDANRIEQANDVTLSNQLIGG